MIFKKRFSLGVSCLLALALVGCSTPKLYHDTEQNIGNAQQKITSTELPGRFPVVQPATKRVAADSSFNMQPVLPAWGKKSSISINARNMPMQFVVDKVLSRTGAMVDYESDVNQSALVSINYTGTVQGALDRIAAATNYSYEVENNTVNWTALVTKTFDISFMPGISQYQVGKASGANKGLESGEGTVFGFNDTGSQFSNMQGNLSVWSDLERTLNELKSPNGKVFVSQATTTVTMSDKPQNVRTMATYLKRLNKELSRQVALDVQVLQVNLSDSYEYGIDWNKVRLFSSNGANFGFSGNLANSINLQPLNSTSSASPGFIMQGPTDIVGNLLNDILLKALSQQGKVSVITQPRTVTLNNQVAELSINTQRSYLRQVTVSAGNAISGTATSTSVTPGVVSTGFNLYILPKVQGNNVYLQISSTLANLVNMDERGFGTDATGKFTIQLPEVDEKRFNQRSLVPNSATLVVAGFKQLRNEANKQQLFGQQALGGHGAAQVNSEIILLITPTILENND
jgi:type IVB pilus formation R64 PilN family outer membrane protein